MAIPRPYDQAYYNLPSIPHVDDDPNAISTLFVSGLPADVNDREIHNLFGGRPGFDYCEIKYSASGNQIVAFAKFVNHPSAIAALHALNGLKFDPQSGSTLHIELARANSNRRNRPGPGANVVIDKRPTTTEDDQESSDDGDSEAEELSEPYKDASTKSDDETYVDSDDTRAAETVALSAMSILFF
ncbi:hypothetical protein L1987_47860 [Smallanthus sonchifolius]|uniref:Uncharacterized protein n=1 Tax=Smallanthus sonchifolius TaxID=185202 RepID=A0ACB9FR95_9ASTR|nr:hypothetical protein L1987_47860 [Smallanthus sonchifolius]